jgi:Protein of unknown function (DUF669)
MKIDFTDVEGQKTFEPVPAGKYLIEVTDYREGTASTAAKNAGAATISWELTIESTATGETEINGTKVEGRKVWENMTLVEASFWRLKAFLEACGFDVSGEIDFDPEEVLNSRLICKVGIQKARKNRESGEEYDPRNTVRSFHPVEEVESK